MFKLSVCGFVRLHLGFGIWNLVVYNRARQLKIIFQGSRVGGNIDQNEPLRLGPMSFGLKLMDHGHFEVLKMH